MSIDPNLDNEVSFITGVTSGGQVAGQSFWAWNGDTPASYSGGHAMKWGGGSAGTAGGVVTYGFDAASNWTQTEQNAFAAAFALWSEVANIQFVQSPTASGAEIDITRSSADTGSEGGMTYTPAGSGGGLGAGVSAVVDIATSVPGFGPVGASFSDYGGYPYLTVLHEIGHAIGLGHAGPYDANVTTSSQDDQAQYSAYDLQAYSVMSYIASGDRSGAHSYQEALQWSYGSSRGDNGLTYANVPITPQMADILAVQRLYGLPTSTPLSGGQTFGFNCNIQGTTEPFFDFTKNTTPIVTLWDEGGGNTLDLSGYSTAETINLNQGAFSSCAGLTNNLAIAYGAQIDTAKAGSGAVTFYGNSDADTFYAGSGTDVMNGGSGGTQFYGGTGTDTYTSGNASADVVHLAGGIQSYYDAGTVEQNGRECLVLIHRDGSGGVQYIDEQIRQITFQDGASVSDTAASLQASGLTAGSSGADTLIAPTSNYADNYVFDGGSGHTTVVLPGNVSDYNFVRVQSTTSQGDEVGAFHLYQADTNYTIDENVSTVRFKNGQYLSTKDLPAYIVGDKSLQIGGDGNDLLYQTPSKHYELFIGGGGHDDLYLNGNTWDYTLETFTAIAAQDSASQGGQTYSGLELVGKNGSGDLLIDSSVETVHFQNGQYLAYSDIGAYVAANPNPSSATIDVALDGDNGALTYQGTSGGDTVLLNGNVNDYFAYRDASGNFTLFDHTSDTGPLTTLTISQSVGRVQFGNGQYLAPQDLHAYIFGSDVFTQGTSGNDLLFTPLSGDSYVVGGDGIDNLYLTGNTRDYTIQAVNVAATSSHSAVTGYELVADNGSGNIYIDNTVETIHFQNGQYLAFHDLTAYVDPFHG